jgi:alpha-L-rhamnosidase
MKKSKWIWCAQNGLREYNQTVLFQKEFEVKETDGALLQITADSWYRVSVNGKWIHDGPARAYPEYFQYDEHDISSALQKGVNRIEVIARYFGIGTFHQIPQQAGLRAAVLVDGGVVGTDSSWQSAPSNAWQQWTPKVSIQMEPFEEYDARLEKILDWQPAVEVKRPGRLFRRNTQLLTRKPRRPQGEPTVARVKKGEPHWCVPVTQLVHGELIEANYYTSRPVVLGSTLTVRKKQQFDFGSNEWKASVNGRLLKTGKVTLKPGRHDVRFFCNSFYGHNKELSFPWLNLKGWGEWTVETVSKCLFLDNDRRWFVSFESKEAQQVERRWQKAIEQYPKGFSALDRSEEQIFMEDPAAQFAARETASRGDAEYCYDFGEQTCGYFEFTVKAEEGVIIDLNAVEYITPEGTIQHTLPFNRNGMRYITKKGVNRFTSLKRRAGQYLFVTIRNAKSPVEIKSVRIIESTAPVTPVQPFKSSDPALNKIWQMSERALKLCMEDTFTDCPLYEQTLWIGDARNEALYAFAAYGNYDVSARSLELGAQSLDRFTIVGCQVPSSWDCQLPAWSFLWGMQVWEHYFHTGDKRFLKKLWPAVLKNLDGAEQYKDKQGLFSGPLWNLLEWAPIDHDNETLLHNSMLLAGALKAAESCAEVLGEAKAAKKLKTRRNKLIRAINAQWDEERRSYPDALQDATGKPSTKTCQHTSMLSIMCDVADKRIQKPALNNLLNPPKDMTTIGSPFAMQFMYEALEKVGEYDALLDSIRTKFQPMIDVGASTVWEMFAGSDFDTHGFPTRSHCHAWASSPIWFLTRIVLGIRQTAAGGTAFEVSPRLCGLTQASGSMATPKGPVHVDWKIFGKTLRVNIGAPKGVKVDVEHNASLRGLEVVVENHRSTVSVN